MKARNNKELKETTELNKLNEPNDYMNPHMTTTDIRAAIYARVSSTGDRQSTERQVIDLTDYADKNGMTLCKTFEEHISGAKKNHERPVLQECLTYCIDEQIDVLLLSELSRLGRNVDEVLANIRFAKENHLNIYFQKEGISIYGADSKENPYLTIMIAVLGTCAQMERENIQYRLQSGRKVYVERNLTETGKSGLGRKVGYRKPIERKKEEYKETLKLLKAGYPIRKVAKLSDVSESTVKRLKREFGI
jgi:DNA invertase Pin-like site-specific DNA recombinase